MFLTRKQDLSKSKSAGTIGENRTEDGCTGAGPDDLQSPDNQQQYKYGTVQQCRSRLGQLLRRRSNSSQCTPPEHIQVQLWARSFDALLNNPRGLNLFRAFVCQEFAEENLNFWIAVEEFKTLPHSSLAARAQRIHDEFIVYQAPSEINVDPATREAISQRLQTASVDMFNAAQRRIQHLLECDIYPRFLQSSMYKSVLKEERSAPKSAR